MADCFSRTLTGNGDTFDPTNATAAYKTTTGDDTFRAPSNNNLDSADFIDGGAGTDALTASITANSHTIAPFIKNVESITLTVAAVDQKTFTFDAADVTGATTVTIRNAGAVSYSTNDELISVTNLAKTTTLGIVGGTESSGTTSSKITATFASAAAADTQNVAISTLGKVGVLTLSTAETVSIAATGTGTTGANTIGSLAASAVKTLNITGSGDLTIAASTLSATPTVNATSATGVIAFTGATAATTTIFNGGTGATTVTTASTGIVKVTTGAGADTVDISGGNSTATIITGAGNDVVKVGAASNITAVDSIVGGDGTDTLVITDSSIGSSTKTTLALGVSGFEVVRTTATSNITVDFNGLSSYDVVEIAGNSSIAAGAAGTSGAGASAGSDAVTATSENSDTLIISGTIVAGAGGAAYAAAGTDIAGAGGAGDIITPKLDNGSNVANLKLYGDADISGGAGGSSGASADTSGDGGIGINAQYIETLNITVQSTATTTGVIDTIAGGAAGATTAGTAGTAGDDIKVGTNATINITDELVGAGTKYTGLDLGDSVRGQNVTINASTFHGNLSVATKDGNTAIYGGLGNDMLTGGTGADMITGGAGSDTITGGVGNDVIDLAETTAASDKVIFSGDTLALNGTDTITGFKAGETSGDILAFTSLSSGALTNATSSTAITLASTTALTTESTTIAVANNKVYVAQVASVATINTAANVITALTDTGALDAVDVAASADAFLVLSAADDATHLYVYGVHNDGTAAVVTGELVLLGTVTVDSTTLTTSNFAFA